MAQTTVNTNFLSQRKYDANRVFRNLMSQLGPNNPTQQIVIQGLVFSSLDQGVIDGILNAYTLFTGNQAMYVRDAAINRVFLGPRAILQAGPLLQVAGQIPVLIRSAPPTPPSAASPASTSMSVSSPQAGDGNAASSATAPAKIPRPPNAFIIYRKSHHADTVAQNPGLHNNQISVIIGAKWNAESAEVRADFKAQAEKLKLEHLRLYPDYSYKPRKPSEKKKRMSKKKAAALLADQLAAENRAKSMQLVDQYQMQPHNQTLVTTAGNTRSTMLPLPALPSDVLDQAIQIAPSGQSSAVTGFGLTPTANYQAAQAADMSFFPELDLDDPAFQALFQEVGEAFEAGYYDHCLVDVQDPRFGDFNYQLQNYN